MDEYQHRNGSLSNGNGWNWIGNVANSLRNVWKYIGNGWNIKWKIWNWHRSVALWAWNGGVFNYFLHSITTRIMCKKVEVGPNDANK